MADGATNSPANRKVVVGGFHTVSGRAKGEWCTVEKPERVTVDDGLDESIFIESQVQSGTVSLALMPSSQSNDVLSALEKAGLPFPILVREADGTTYYSSARVRVAGMAPVRWTDGSEVRLWKLVSTRLLGTTGGMSATAIATEAP